MKPALTIPPTDRLAFRLMDAGDTGLLWALDQDPEVMRFLNDGKPTPREEIEDYILPRMLAFTDPARGTGLWAIDDRDGRGFLGWILVREYGFATDYHTPDNLELGWRLKRSHWGRGITTEAARAIMAVVQYNTGVRAFSALADADNLASIAVMKKLGMQYVDDRVNHTPKGDYPVVYYEMLNPALC